MPTADLLAFQQALAAGGVHGALAFLNGRTPHRFTGVYRFDGDILRNEALFDRFEPALRRGGDVPLNDTYCAIVGRSQCDLELLDARVDPRIEPKVNTPVVSYCGTLIRDAHGMPFGTLCHYDMLPCEQRTSDVPLLEAAAAILHRAITASGRLTAA